ncbi:MAG TPA: tol-pal system-associated acyl-CoA thioesterase [Burkholderiales bacterium]|nr:tol-pal system-associated acyl-CoA thioesterase [Burkholderiales bacterium]
MRIRVYYEDTDAAGVVYYANYLKFMERARTEWLRAIGFEQDELVRRDRVMFVVRSAAIEFLKPARFNDAIDVDVAIAGYRGASINFAQHIRRAATVLCAGEIRVACVDSASQAPCALPAALTARLKEISP